MGIDPEQFSALTNALQQAVLLARRRVVEARAETADADRCRGRWRRRGTYAETKEGMTMASKEGSDMTIRVLISGDFKVDDNWSAPVNKGQYPPCPDCGDPLHEQRPAEIETGLPDSSLDADAVAGDDEDDDAVAVDAKEVACGCGSLFTVVTVVGEVTFSNRLRRKHFSSKGRS